MSIRWPGWIVLLLPLLGCTEGAVNSATPTPTPTQTPNTLTFTETAGDFATGTLNGTAPNAAGELELTYLLLGETGSLLVADTVDQGQVANISFSRTYADPAVFAFIPTRNAGGATDVRATSVTTTGAQLFMEEAGGGAHGAETVTWMVVETGRHLLAGGFEMEVGIHQTASVHRNGNTPAGDAISFGQAFSAVPVLLSTLNTYFNGNFASSIAHTATASGFVMEQEAGNTGNAVQTESLAWLAMVPGMGTIQGTPWAVGSVPAGANCGPAETAITFTFPTAFAMPPDVIADGQTPNGNAGYWSRGAGTWNTTTLTVFCDEAGDNTHTGEGVGYAAFEMNTALEGYVPNGERVSPIFDLSSLVTAGSSRVTWNATEPSGTTTLTIETNVSLDGGATWLGWTAATNDGPISGLDPGTDISQGAVQTRASFLSIDETASPSLQELAVEVTGL